MNAVAIARKDNLQVSDEHVEKVINYLNNTGIECGNQNKHEKAEAYFKAVIQLYEPIQDQPNNGNGALGKLLFNLSEAYFYQEKFEELIKILPKLISILENTPSDDQDQELANACCYLALTHIQNSNSEEDVKFETCKNALDAIKKLPLESSQIFIGYEEKIIEYLSTAMKIANEKGIEYNKQQNYPEAVEFFKKAIQLHSLIVDQSDNDNGALGVYLFNLSNAQFFDSNFNEVIEIASKLIPILKKIPQNRRMMI